MQSTPHPGLEKYAANSNSDNYLPRQRTSAGQKSYLGICAYMPNLHCLDRKEVVEDEKFLNPETRFHSLLS